MIIERLKIRTFAAEIIGDYMPARFPFDMRELAEKMCISVDGPNVFVNSNYEIARLIAETVLTCNGSDASNDMEIAYFAVCLMIPYCLATIDQIDDYLGNSNYIMNAFGIPIDVAIWASEEMKARHRLHEKLSEDEERIVSKYGLALDKTIYDYVGYEYAGDCADDCIDDCAVDYACDYYYDYIYGK